MLFGQIATDMQNKKGESIDSPFRSRRAAEDVIPAGFEPTTHSLEGCCSIQLSYETMPEHEGQAVQK